MEDDQVAVAIERPVNEYLIRTADEVRLDRVWQVFERYSDGTVSIAAMGGGKVYRIPKDKMDELRPIDPWEEITDTWIPGLFIIDIDESSPGIRGFHKRQRWNGFACPVLLEEDIEKLRLDWEKHVDPEQPDATCRLEKREGKWWLYTYWDEDDDSKNWEEQRSFEVEYLGKKYECWDIGTFGLCWHDAEHDWITSVTTAKELPDQPYAWLVNQGCNGRQMQGVHHPPSLIDCWVKCSCPVCS